MGIRAEQPADNQRLRQAVGLACSSSPAASTVMLERGDWPPLLIGISPLRGAPGGRQALLLAYAETNSVASRARALRELFGLSLSEAEIALRIAAGRTAAEIAQERHVSIGTIRAQLKSAFVKLGCSRQTDLAIVVSSIPLSGEVAEGYRRPSDSPRT